jgi:hypothetical protein
MLTCCRQLVAVSDALHDLLERQGTTPWEPVATLVARQNELVAELQRLATQAGTVTPPVSPGERAELRAMFARAVARHQQIAQYLSQAQQQLTAEIKECQLLHKTTGCYHVPSGQTRPQLDQKV